MRRLSVVAVSVVVLITVLAASAGARSSVDPVTVSAVADTYLRSGASDTNEGASSFLRLRASGDNRALVRFDQTEITQAVGSGSLVSASLEFTISDNGNNWGATGRTISVFRLTSPWMEGNGFVDHGSPPNRGTGSGATWNCATDTNIANQANDCSGATEWEMAKPSQPQLHPWVEPATASTLITNGLAGTVSFDVTPDVQAFLSGTTNNGWIVKKDLEGPAGLVEFASRGTSGGPRLVLNVDQGSSDSTLPAVTATGMSSFSPPGEFTNGQGDVSIDVVAGDNESGVQRVSISAGAIELASTSLSCAPACPASVEATLSFGSASLADGTHALTARAIDGAGNAGSQPFALWVDRVAPLAVTSIRLSRFEGTVATFAWAEGSDPTLLGGDPGAGVERYTYRYRHGVEAWSEVMTTDVPEFDLAGASLGEIVDVEVGAIDAVGNVGPTELATLTVFAASEPVAWYSDTGSNPAPEVLLTPAQVSQASAAVLGDSRIAALLSGSQPRIDQVTPWSTEFTTSSVVGADVTVTWDTPTTLETDWPLADFSDDGQTYTEELTHYRATSVLSLNVLVTFDPLEVVAFDVVDGDVDPGSIAQVSSSSPRVLAVSTATAEGAGDVRNAYNVYRLTDKILPQLRSDVFWNWDFRKKVSPISQPQMVAEADWPVAVIFRGMISVDTAKLIWSGRSLQNPMRALVKDGLPHQPARATTSKEVWDRDEGAYLGNACYGHKWHYRAYAPSPQDGGDDRMYNIALGYYVIATIHQDHHDPDPKQRIRCGPGPWHGGTDAAESKLARAADGFASLSTQIRFDSFAHSFNLRNYDERGRRGRRVYDSDGWATDICARLAGEPSPCYGD